MQLQILQPVCTMYLYMYMYMYMYLKRVAHKCARGRSRRSVLKKTLIFFYFSLDIVNYVEYYN